MIPHLPKRTLGSAVLFAAVLTVMPQRLPAAPGASICAANPANRVMDFWLGDWSVSAPGSAPNATSRISLDLDQCVVVERWDGGRGHIGENVFAYNADDKSWRGMFADNKGRVHIFPSGRAASGSIQFSGQSTDPTGKPVLNRVTIRRVDADRVEQLWEKSSDGGRSWTAEFRGEYTRKRS